MQNYPEEAERLYPVYLDASWRLYDIDLFVNKSSDIVSRICDEVRELRLEDDITRAYEIIRSVLSSHKFGVRE